MTTRLQIQCLRRVATATLGILTLLMCLAFSSERTFADLSNSEPALSITLPRVSTGVGAGTQTRGYTFSLDDAKILTHLGLYTWSNEFVLAEDRQIGVWDDAGSLVAEVIIPAGGGELEGGQDNTFFYGELAAPVTLSAGETYTVGVWYNGDISPNAPGIGMMVDFTTLAGFNYGETVETGPPGGAFVKPTITRPDRPNSYLGPNLRFSTAPAPTPAPVGHWTFEEGIEGVDLTGNFADLVLEGDAQVSGGSLDINGSGTTSTGWAHASALPTSAPIANKTLVSWITLQGLENVAKSGAALSLDLQSGDRFDGIVYAERNANRWMNGSSGFQRTPAEQFDQTAVSVETSTGTPIQLAISYEDLGGGQVQITGYRDGVLMGSYQIGNFASWVPGEYEVLFGPRHTNPNPNGALDALVHEARLYDQVLTQEQIAGLTLVSGSDSDGDGLADFREQQVIDADPNDDIRTLVDVNPGDDLDGDNLTNEEEFDLGTNALKADSDDDGLNDDVEVALGTDPTDADTDDDGRGDGAELRHLLSGTMDPLQAGTNGGFGTFDQGVAGAGDGSGTISGSYDADANLLAYIITWMDLSASVTNMHFHGGAPGVGGGVDVGIPGPWSSPQSASGVSVSAAAESNLLAGNWYVNVHTSNFGGGEIRGQVVVTAPTDPLDFDSDDDGLSDGDEIAAGSDPNDPNDPALESFLVGHWTFNAGEELIDRTGNFSDLVVEGDGAISGGSLDVNGAGTGSTGWAHASALPTSSPIGSKTLVSWITLQSLEDVVKTGAALSIDMQSGDRFDGIVFAERDTNRWMNGSSNFQRTPPGQFDQPSALETTTGTPIQLAISYQDLGGGQVQITGYRDGVEMGSYSSGFFASWAAGEYEALFGPRHSNPGPIGGLDALIHEARLYNKALSQAEIAGLSIISELDSDMDGLPDTLEQQVIDSDPNDAIQTLADVNPGDDLDGDNLDNAHELTVSHTNPLDADTDDDGLTDEVETNTGVYVSAADTGTDPNDPDTDGDGLKDGVETNTNNYQSESNTGTDPHNGDSDGDGLSDGEEVAAGTDPTDSNDPPPPPFADTLVGHWTFEPGEELIDLTGNFPDLSLEGDASIVDGQLDVNGTGTTASGWAYTTGGSYAGPPIGDRTLVSWVTLENLDVRAGSALTLDRVSGDQFDGIIWAEQNPNRWMAGSNGFARTTPFTAPGDTETETGKRVMIAITYRDLGGTTEVTGYRDGVQIGQYSKGPLATWATGDAEAIFGKRHGNPAPTGPGGLDALIDEARIYAAAATAQDILDLLAPPTPANYQEAVNLLNPDYYYQLNETMTASGAVDSTGHAAPGVYNGDYVNGPAMVGIPGPLEVNGGIPVPGVGGASNLAHLSANAGHITLGDGAAYGASAMTVALFIKAGPGAQGGDRVFTNNLTDGTQSFQIVIGNNGLVVAVDPNASGANAERTLYLEDNSDPDRRFLDGNAGWFHVIASTEGATGAERAANIRVWVNGVDRTSNLMPDVTGWGTDTGMAKIGGRRANATDTTTHSGGQDEVAIWLNRVLTDQEAASLWEAAVTPPAGPARIQLTDIRYDEAAGEVTIEWESKIGATYTLQWSSDLGLTDPGWIDAADTYPAGGATSDRTSYTFSGIPAGTLERYFRVAEE